MAERDDSHRQPARGDDKGQQEQQDSKRPPGATDSTGGEQQLQHEPARGSRATQGNLGTTQREWSQRADLADSDEE